MRLVMNLSQQSRVRHRNLQSVVNLGSLNLPPAHFSTKGSNNIT